jgi:tetratricopeptide (TPR) repeat protein
LENSCQTLRPVDQKGAITRSVIANAEGKEALSPAGQLPLFDNTRRRDLVFNYRLALVLDSEDPLALDNLAYSLVFILGEPWFNPAEGLALARNAVALEPHEWSYWHTLGLAAVRTGDWDTAANALQQALTFTGGQACNTFLLAMTYWHQGNRKDARLMYDRAVAWMEKNKPNDSELGQFRAEAAELLGLSCRKPEPGPRPNITAEPTHRSRPEAASSDVDAAVDEIERHQRKARHEHGLFESRLLARPSRMAPRLHKHQREAAPRGR